MATLASIAIPAACSTAGSPIQIIEIGRTQIDTTASFQEGADELCQGWSLNADQAKTFLLLSSRVDLRTYIHYYDTAPCKVAGKLLLGGKAWDFAINGASKASLTSDGEVQYLTCSASACEALAMWFPGNDSAAGPP